MTKLPHYVLPLYPAIAILIAGIVEGGGLYRKAWLVRGTVGWFLFPAVIAIAVPVGFFILSRDLGLAAWPFAAAALIAGLFAWWLYEVDGAERALLRGMVSSVFIAITVYAVAFPMLPVLFPSALVAENVRASGCANPQLASTFAYQEPSLVFLLGTDTRFTDGAGAAEFIEWRTLPFRAGRCPQRTQLRAAGGFGRLALHAEPAHRRLQYQQWQAVRDGRVSHGRADEHGRRHDDCRVAALRRHGRFVAQAIDPADPRLWPASVAARLSG